jgi:hypothetical protein
MPRHPPCALHSLSHTPPTQPTHHPTHTTTPHTTPHKQGSNAQGITHAEQQRAHQAGDAHSTQLQRNFDARVHYPDLKQQPHTHQPPIHTDEPWQAGNQATTPHHPTSPPRATTTHNERRQPQDKPRDGCGSDSSEPQQCAPTHQTSRRLPPRRDPCLPGMSGGEMSMIPLVNTTMTPPPPTPGTITAGTDDELGVCSLERR